MPEKNEYTFVSGLYHDTTFTTPDGSFTLPKASSEEDVPRAIYDEVSPEEITFTPRFKPQGVEVYELDYLGLEDPDAFAQQLAKVEADFENARQQPVLIMSRCAIRAALLSEYKPDQTNSKNGVTFAYPSALRRSGGRDNKPVSAGAATIPSSWNVAGARRPEVMSKRRDLSAITKIVNHTPESLYINGTLLKRQATMEPNYRYSDPIGTSNPGNVPINRLNAIRNIKLPKSTEDENTLTVVHPEALLEYWRLWGYNEREYSQISRLAFPHPGRMNRNKSGQQGQNTTALAVFSAETLKRVVKDIGF